MVDSLDVLTAQGEIALAQGNPVEALRLWRAADKRGCESCFHVKYARAFEALKQPDSSRVWYEKYLAAYETDNSLGDTFVLAHVHKWLGEYYDERQQWVKAIKSYQDFTTLWEKADPALQPAVRAVKERIVLLQKKVG
jgi:tetratricopeptide (TPR) repeat protein